MSAHDSKPVPAHAPRPFPVAVFCARPGQWCGDGVVAHTHEQIRAAVADREAHMADCLGPPKPSQLWPLPPPPRPFTLLLEQVKAPR